MLTKGYLLTYLDGPHWSGSDGGDWDDDNDDDDDCDDGDGHDEDRQDDGDDDDGAPGNNFCVYEGGVAKGECFTKQFYLFWAYRLIAHVWAMQNAE